MRGKDKTCRAIPMPNGRCKLHGGKSLSGIASGTFKTGRYSKDLPSNLTARFGEAEADPELVELRSEIALLDTLMGEELQRFRPDDPHNRSAILEMIEQRRKLVDSEAKRLKDMQQNIPVEKAMLIITAIADSIRRHVTDRTALAAIQTDLSRLLSSNVHGPGNP